MPQTPSFFIPRELLLYILSLANVFRFDQGRRRPHNPLADRWTYFRPVERDKLDFGGVA